MMPSCYHIILFLATTGIHSPSSLFTATHSYGQAEFDNMVSGRPPERALPLLQEKRRESNFFGLCCKNDEEIKR
jgi:hypothetical protein